jgi:hypothetical protein
MSNVEPASSDGERKGHRGRDDEAVASVDQVEALEGVAGCAEDDAVALLDDAEAHEQASAIHLAVIEFSFPHAVREEVRVRLDPLAVHDRDLAAFFDLGAPRQAR